MFFVWAISVPAYDMSDFTALPDVPNDSVDRVPVCVICGSLFC